MERRVDEPDHDRLAVHRLEQAAEVGTLHGQELIERFASIGRAHRHDHPLHDRQPFLFEEHVLGAAQADPFRPV